MVDKYNSKIPKPNYDKKNLKKNGEIEVMFEKLSQTIENLHSKLDKIVTTEYEYNLKIEKLDTINKISKNDLDKVKEEYYEYKNDDFNCMFFYYLSIFEMIIILIYSFFNINIL